jgi:small subunit ribosomal protein S1
VVRKGETVKVQILNIDTENKRISLSIKDLQENPWQGLGQKYSVGVESEGKVVRLLDKGVVVDLGGDVEGFVPISQLGYRNLENPADKFREGDLLVLKVIESDPDSRRIVLSVIDIPSHRERGEEDVIVEPTEPVVEEAPEARREAKSTQMADAMAEAQIEVGAGSSEAAEEAADRESLE